MGKGNEQGKDGEVFRLRDMIVESVDLVDRPANLKRFLVFKREEEMSGKAALTTAAPAGSATVEVQEADVEAGAKPTDKAAAAPAAPPATNAATAAGAQAATGVAKAADPKGTEAPVQQPDAGKPAAASAPAAPASAAAAAAAPASTDKAAVDVKKAAETHAALLREKLDAMGKIASEIATNAGSMTPQDLRAKLSQLESLGWKVGEVAEVVNVSKSDTGTPTETAKVEMPAGVKEAAKKTLREAVERLMSVSNALRVATVTQEQSSAPLPDPVYREVNAILTLVKNLLQKYPAPKAKAGEEAGKTEPANDAKQPVGKAEPEPVGNATALDLMKQAPSLSLPAPVRDAVAERVRGATEILLSAIAAVDKVGESTAQMTEPMPAEIAGAMGKAVAALEEAIQKYPAPAAKCDGIISSLREHFTGIEQIVKSVLGGAPAAKVEPAVKPAVPAAAGTDALTGLGKRLDEIAADVKKHAEAISKIQGTPQNSNAMEDDGKGGEGGRAPTTKGKKVEWPSDLAAAR